MTLAMVSTSAPWTSWRSPSGSSCSRPPSQALRSSRGSLVKWQPSERSVTDDLPKLSGLKLRAGAARHP
eukprot:7189362-Pyramimonas_sp.AAC.1